MSLRHLAAKAALVILLTGGAHAASTPVEMLRDMFRRPVTEWKQVLGESKPLLDEQFFQNIERRIRWGIENNHVDDAFRFAMVGDFAAELKNRPANFRIDLAELFFQAENSVMTGQIVDNILVTSPGTPAAKKARFLRGRLFEMRGDLFQAHAIYVESAKDGYEAGLSWYKAGQISLLIQEEDRAFKEFESAAKAGHVQAGVELEKLKAMRTGNWDDPNVIPPLENTPGIDTRTGLENTTVVTPPAADPLAEAEVAVEAGELAVARAKLTEVYQKTPQELEVARRLGALLYRMGELEEAKAFLDAAIAKHPNNGDLYRYRANTLERLYDRTKQAALLKEALEDYAQASKLSPNNTFLSHELGRAKAKL